MKKSESFVPLEKPFLLIYEQENNRVNVAWFSTEEDLAKCTKKVNEDGGQVIKAIEISSCRNIRIDEKELKRDTASGLHYLRKESSSNHSYTIQEIDEILGHTRGEHFVQANALVNKANQFSHGNDDNAIYAEVHWLKKAYEAIEQYIPQYRKAEQMGTYLQERIRAAYARKKIYFKNAAKGNDEWRIAIVCSQKCVFKAPPTAVKQLSLGSGTY